MLSFLSCLAEGRVAGVVLGSVLFLMQILLACLDCEGWCVLYYDAIGVKCMIYNAEIAGLLIVHTTSLVVCLFLMACI